MTPSAGTQVRQAARPLDSEPEGRRSRAKRAKQAKQVKRAKQAMEAETGLRHRKWWTPYLFLAPGLVMVTMFSLWPFVNTVILSFTDAQILRGGGFVGFDNYTRAFADSDFWVATGNSVLYLLVVVPCLVLLPLALAVLVQREVPGIGIFRSAFYTPVIASAVVVGLIWQWVLRSDGLVNTLFQSVFTVLVATLMFPFESVMISMFLTVREMGLVDTLIGVWLPGAVSVLNIMIMRSAFLAVPQEVEEAAVLDGANEWTRFTRVFLPAAKGALAVVCITSFMGAWDDFLWPLLILTNSDNYTLQLGLKTLAGATTVSDQRIIAAGAMAALIPMMLLFFALQRFFFKGVGEGAVKT